MEPFAVQSSPGLVRPALELQGDLAAVLREGRVLSGEVLQTFDGGTLLIGVGRHRVPAESQVRMQPGQRFLFQVRLEGGRTALELLAPEGASESTLLRALRAALSGGKSGAGDLGERLGQLASRLADLDPSLPEALRAAAFRGAAPAAGPAPTAREVGARLAAALAASGQGYEAGLGERAMAGLGARAAGALGVELAGLLLEELAQASGVERGRLAAGLGAFLAGGVASEHARPGLSPGGLAEMLRAGLEGLAVTEGERQALWNGLARALPSPGLGRALEALVLAALRPGTRAAAAELREGLDLKGLLLGLLAGSDDSAVRETAGRALETIEREQLLNLARARSGEPWCVSLPLCFQGEWATARLVARGSRESEGTEGAGAHRFTLAVDFRHTGPVRADLAVRTGEAGPASVAVRLLAAREDVLERMRGAARELETRLGHGGRRVSLAFGLASEPTLRLEREQTDIRFLREHHVLDRSG